MSKMRTKYKKISITALITVLLIQMLPLFIFAESAPELTLSEREYIKSPTVWKGNMSKDGILQTNIYPQSTPLVKRIGDITVLAWISDNRNRNSANRTELVYSVQTGVNGSWTEPRAVDNDNTADFYPYLYGNGNQIYITWQNIKKTFTDNEATIEKVSAASEIKVSEFNLTSKSFGNPVALTDNETLDKLPMIAGNGNKTYAVWTSNNANDLFDVKGSNSLMYSNRDGDVWSQPVSLNDNLGKVISMSCEVYMDKLYIVYSKDNDDKLETITDREVFCTIVDNGAVKKTVKITNNSSIDSMPTLIKRNNKLMVIWYADKNIMFTDNIENPSPQLFLPDEIDGFNDNFKVVFDDSNISLLWTKASYDATEGYAALYDEVTQKMSNVVKITKSKDSFISIDGLYNSNGDLMLYSNIQRIIEKVENGNTSYSYGLNDLCVDKVIYETNGAIQKDTVSWDEYDFVPGEEMLITFDFKNIGTRTISSFEVELYDGDPKIGGKKLGSSTLNEYLRAGCTKNITIGFTPKEAKQYDLFINVKVNNDVDNSDNRFNFTTGYSDVCFESVFVTGSDDIKQIQVVIGSNSNVPAKGVKFKIVEDSETGNVISETYFNEIERGRNKNIVKQIDTKNMEFGKNGSKAIYLVLESESEDYIIGNNVHSIIVLKPEVGIPFEINIVSAGLKQSKDAIMIDLAVGNKSIDGIIKGKLNLSLYEKATDKLVQKHEKIVEVRRYANFNVMDTFAIDGTYNGEYYLVADISRVPDDNIPQTITQLCKPQIKWVGIYTDGTTIKYPDSPLVPPASIIPSNTASPSVLASPESRTAISEEDIVVKPEFNNNGGSTITTKQYKWSKNDIEPTNWIDYTGGDIKQTQDGEWYLYLKAVNSDNNETVKKFGPYKKGKTVVIPDDIKQGVGIDDFIDINKHWAREYIIKLLNEKVVSGYPDKTMKPDNSITRAEAVKIIVVALGYTPAEKPDLKFKDIGSIGSWAMGYIDTGVKKGIVKGFDDNTFQPGKKCSRVEFVTMLLRAMDLSVEKTTTLKFKDTNNIPDWALPYMEKAVEIGMIKGYTDNTILPKKDVTRAEAFTMVARSVFEMK